MKKEKRQGKIKNYQQSVVTFLLFSCRFYFFIFNLIMKPFLLFLIKFYKSLLSPDKGIFRRRMPTCVFYPTCSDYAEEAIKKHGVMKGSYLAIKRIIRCHPWQKEHVDLVPNLNEKLKMKK